MNLNKPHLKDHIFTGTFTWILNCCSIAMFFRILPFLRFSRILRSSDSLCFSASRAMGFALSCQSLSVIQWPALVYTCTWNRPLVLSFDSVVFRS